MKNFIKLGAIIILLIIVLVILNLNESTPASPIFPLKRIEEKVFLKLKLSPENKITYQSFLLNSRLKELVELASKRQYSYILDASLRYSATAGQLTEVVLQNPETGQSSQVVKQFEDHKIILQNLYNSYPADDTERKYLQDDKNYLDLYIEKLKQLS